MVGETIAVGAGLCLSVGFLPGSEPRAMAESLRPCSPGSKSSNDEETTFGSLVSVLGLTGDDCPPLGFSLSSTRPSNLISELGSVVSARPDGTFCPWSPLDFVRVGEMFIAESTLEPSPYWLAAGEDPCLAPVPLPSVGVAAPCLSEAWYLPSRGIFRSSADMRGLGDESPRPLGPVETRSSVASSVGLGFSVTGSVRSCSG